MWKWEWICWFVNLVSRDPEERVRRYRRLIERLSREADLDGGWWRVFHDYPKKAVPSTASLSHPNSSDHPDGSTAIVVQGPVIERDDLTIETLALYRKTMPHSRLILSTWEGTPTEVIDRIESLGVSVVTSEMPSDCGPHNLNLQITTTRRGLQEAEKLGCRHAMKTRADTRIHMADADTLCHDLLREFPFQGTGDQTQRMIVLDFATHLHVPHHLSDIMMFGRTEDLLVYWSADGRCPGLATDQTKQLNGVPLHRIPEIILCRSYLQRSGIEVTEQLDHWWELLAERFLVVDRAMIDLFWPKYNYNVNQRLEMCGENNRNALCHFAQWLQLRSRSLAPSVSADQTQRHVRNPAA
ncbi:WavE lipopolysaccharide synthesis family protein [Rhodopirellula sp. JC639]|uniref:WavE lipopolysaccharide synthesis family protein n=1 Tax=Stieleria mannarensis TaxID=2755585 RepID=UPI0015FFF287|nr:WavE lipopolysaccharide synthesis family protein [Rhodopirellula sp. JC639]